MLGRRRVGELAPLVELLLQLLHLVAQRRLLRLELRLALRRHLEAAVAAVVDDAERRVRSPGAAARPPARSDADVLNALAAAVDALYPPREVAAGQQMMLRLQLGVLLAQLEQLARRGTSTTRHHLLLRRLVLQPVGAGRCTSSAFSVAACTAPAAAPAAPRSPSRFTSEFSSCTLAASVAPGVPPAACAAMRPRGMGRSSTWGRGAQFCRLGSCSLSA